MSGRRVVLLADLVADRFVTGTPKRISREAPVLILRQDHDETVPGGGANAAANVASLGGKAVVLGAVGDDASGRALLEALAERGADVAHTAVVAGYRTPTKTRILGGGRHAIKQQIVRFDVEDDLGDDPTIGRLLIPEGITADAVIISDYGYGAATPGHVAKLRVQLPLATFVCDSRFRLADFAAIDAATPNEEEAEGLLGGSLDPDLATKCQNLRRRLGLQFLLVTRGSAGMVLATDGATVAFPVHGTDEVADVTGAGDTVIATVTLALSAGASPLEAAVLANYAGGIVVMKRGTATVTPPELVAAIEHDHKPLEEIVWVVS